MLMQLFHFQDLNMDHFPVSPPVPWMYQPGGQETACAG